MIFKVRHEKKGGHIHCRLFAAKSPNMTYASCGDFCVREEEFEDLERAMSGVQFESIPDLPENEPPQEHSGLNQAEPMGPETE